MAKRYRSKLRLIYVVQEKASLVLGSLGREFDSPKWLKTEDFNRNLGRVLKRESLIPLKDFLSKKFLS